MFYTQFDHLVVRQTICTFSYTWFHGYDKTSARFIVNQQPPDYDDRTKCHHM